MPGLLSVVATPIGNLEDITLRALRVLREADLVAAEDTRHTAKLLRHHGIQARTLSFHAHNTRSRVPQLIARLSGGARVALVTDAGTPGVSDPGVELVQACRSQGITVEAVPGPSASMAAAVVSGFPLIPLTVFGFPPVRSKDRNAWFAEAAKTPHTFTFFEAPHRIDSTLRLCARYLGNRQICVARELTKIHEEAVVFWLNDLERQAYRSEGRVYASGFAGSPCGGALRTDGVRCRASWQSIGRFRPACSIAPGEKCWSRWPPSWAFPAASVYPALERAKRGS